MSNVLQRLHDSGRRLVTPELGRGEIERYPEEVVRGFVEPLPRVIELDALDEAITEILASTTQWESGEIDPRAAIEIHRALPLSRREAGDWGVWRYLAVVHRPDFIRIGGSSGRGPRSRRGSGVPGLGRTATRSGGCGGLRSSARRTGTTS